MHFYDVDNSKEVMFAPVTLPNVEANRLLSEGVRIYEEDEKEENPDKV